MQDLSHLAGLSEFEFERERCRLIGQFIDSAPPDIRKKLLAKQIELDMRRDTMPAAQFMETLLIELGENLENLSDQMVYLKNTVVKK